MMLELSSTVTNVLLLVLTMVIVLLWLVLNNNIPHNAAYVEWHGVGVISSWAKLHIVMGSFGYPKDILFLKN